MIVIVPTRNRPLSAADLIECWRQTDATATLFFAVNDDDPQLQSYHTLLVDAPDFVRWLRVPATNMGEALQYAAQRTGKHDVVGFMGDDHRPRTPRWDARIRDEFGIRGPAVVYGDDRIHGRNLPTQVFLPGEFVRRVGHMAPPGLIHLYLDNYWRELGLQAGALHFLADVIIEHMHPIAGKAEWDEDYVRVNSGGVYQADAATFAEFDMAPDVATLIRLREEWSA